MQLDNYTDAELVAMPRVNVQLLDEVLDHVIDHQDQWNQNTYRSTSTASSCGTTHCFGGWALAMTGQLDTNGELVNGEWYTEGRDVLGLTDTEANRLFYATIHPHPGDDGVPAKVYQLRNVKVEVERIRARAKAQEAAFNRLAQEFIDAAGLDDVVKPGYLCPESEQVMQGIKGGASE